MVAKFPLLRDPRDRLPVVLAVAHALLLATVPPWWVIGLLLWWNANTVSHQFTHRRFFRSRVADGAFSLGLSLLLGFPQRLWRQRHLAHHRDAAWRLRSERGLVVEAVAVFGAWGMLAACAPGLFVSHWLPGCCLGQVLCALQGHGEHRGGTTSIHAAWWNLLFLNDGFHVEHHHAPTVHFRDLPARRLAGARHSNWPPVLRWLDRPWLCHLEALVLRWPWLQVLVLHEHRRALRTLLAEIPAPRSVIVVGGGLFPRTAILLRELLPHAEITVLDADQRHLERAAPLLPAGVRSVAGTFTPGQLLPCDLVVLPLALHGDRLASYERPPAPAMLVHDWLWRPRGSSTVVAWWLGKRLNLVRARLDPMCAVA